MTEANEKSSKVIKLKKRISEELNEIDKDIKDMEKAKKDSVEKLEIKKVELKKYSNIQEVCDEHYATLQEIEQASTLIEERKISITALDTTIANLDLQISQIQSEHDKAVAELEKKRRRLNDYLKYYEDLNDKLEKLIELLGEEERKHCLELNKLKVERAKTINRTDLSEETVNKTLKELDKKMIDLNKEHGKLIDSISQKLSDITVDASAVEELLSKEKKKSPVKKKAVKIGDGDVRVDGDVDVDVDIDIDIDDGDRTGGDVTTDEVITDEDGTTTIISRSPVAASRKKAVGDKVKIELDKDHVKVDVDVDIEEEDEDEDEDEKEDEDEDEDEEDDADLNEEQKAEKAKIRIEKKEMRQKERRKEKEKERERREKERKEKVDKRESDDYVEDDVVDTVDRVDATRTTKVDDEKREIGERIRAEGKPKIVSKGPKTDFKTKFSLSMPQQQFRPSTYAAEKGKIVRPDAAAYHGDYQIDGERDKDERTDEYYDDSDYRPLELEDWEAPVAKEKKKGKKKAAAAAAGTAAAAAAAADARKKAKKKKDKKRVTPRDEHADEEEDEDESSFDEELLDWFTSNEKDIRSDLLRQGLQITPSNRIITKDDRVVTLKQAQRLGLLHDFYVESYDEEEGDLEDEEEEREQDLSEEDEFKRAKGKKKKIRGKQVKYYKSPASSASSLGKESSESHICGRDMEYLKVVFGKSLTMALAEITAIQPTDPIHYLAHWMLKYRYNQEIDQITRIQIQELMIEQERLAAEKWHRELQEEARLAVLEALFRAENIIIQQDFQSELQLREYEGEFEETPAAAAAAQV